MTAGQSYRTAENASGRAPSPRFVLYLGLIRYREVLILQGSPLLGAAFAMRQVSASSVARLAVFVAASILLVAHVFALNDWSGMAPCLGGPGDAAVVANGVSRTEIGWLSIALLAPSLLLFAAIGPPTLMIALAIAVLSFAYSAPVYHAKGIPIVNSTIHLFGGFLHFLLGYSLFRPIDGRGIAIALFFALPFVAGHLIQEVRDYDGDSLNGIRTNAVAFGKTRAFIAGLVIFTLAYVQIVLLAMRGVLPGAMAVVVVLYPLHLYWSMQTMGEGLTAGSIRHLQSRYRALFAIIGFLMIAMLTIQRWR